MNQDIKAYAKAMGVKLWQVADKCEMTDSQFSRTLRYSLEDGLKEKVINAIDVIAIENK